MPFKVELPAGGLVFRFKGERSAQSLMSNSNLEISRFLILVGFCCFTYMNGTINGRCMANKLFLVANRYKDIEH